MTVRPCNKHPLSLPLLPFVSTAVKICLYHCVICRKGCHHLSPQLTSSVCTAVIICLYNYHHMSLELSSSVSVAVIMSLQRHLSLHQSQWLTSSVSTTTSSPVIVCFSSCHHLSLQLSPSDFTAGILCVFSSTC